MCIRFESSSLSKNILSKKVKSDYAMKMVKAKKEHTQLIMELLEELPLLGQRNQLSKIVGEEQLSHSISMQNRLIYNLIEQENATVFLAEDQGLFIGYLIVINGHSTPIKHVAHVFISVLESYRRQGIGLKLFKEMEDWAKESSIQRLELMVVSSNEPAIKLFKSCGFEIEGLKRNSLKIGEHFVHEYIMAKILM